MIYKARNYQKFTTEKIINSPVVGAFLDMGLGKTVSTLFALKELIEKKESRRILVVAPKKVAETVWTDELKKWDGLENIKASVVLGSEKERRKALTEKADIFVINRENVVWLVSLLGSNWNFDTVVIDELSSFKSHKSQRFKSLKLVRKYIKRIIGLTGTPAPNGLLDLWAPLFLLDRGERLGTSFSKYREQYFNAGKRNGHVVFNYSLKKGDPVLGEDFYNLEIIDRIKDICFSMATEDYLELPPRIDQDIFITLPARVMSQYLEFEKDQVLQFAENTEDITAVNAAALSNKLLQFANGAVYDENKVYHVVHNEKIEALKEYAEALEGKPILLFYAFISDKERIKKEFPKARELKNPTDISDWNAGKIDMLIAHPASAGHGLNLQFGGQNVVWFNCPWSLEQYQQGLKRLHRSGVVGVVTNTRLIVRGSLDEDVLARLTGKDSTQNALIEAVKARIEKYTKSKF